jgi:outer membrane protein insertion porin family
VEAVSSARMRWLSPLLLFLLAACNAVAQHSLPGAEAAYQGETVNSIDLVTNPHVDVEPFRALLAQKAGEPYSQDKVQASLAALEQTNKFGAIRASVTPQPQGLRLTFILEPAYYAGIIEFPELAKHFSYIRLLQVVNFSNENPYDKSLLPEAVTALEQFLREQGYFQGQVHAETALDDINKITNITFRANMGKRARIGKVQIEGPNTSEAAHIMHAVRSLRARFSGGLLKPGKPYTAGRISEAQTLIKRSLASQNYLARKLQLQPPQYHPETNRVDLTFHVDPGPVVLVRTTGARLTFLPFMSGREKKKLIPVYSEGTIDRDLVNEGQQNLIDYFQKKGYFDVTVNTIFDRQPDKISLTYQIDKGRKHKVARILFQGNHQISEKDLLDHIPIKKAHIVTHGEYSEKMLKTSRKNIEALYHDIGYEDVKITSQVIDHEPKIDVRFKIDEGQQTLVDNVSVTGNKNVPYEQLAGKSGMQLRSGAPFSPGKLASDRNQISATYLSRGYLNSEVKAVVSRGQGDPHRLDVTYQVTENQLVRIRQVLYMGQKHTRGSLLRKTAQLKPETPLSQEQLLASEARLYDLQIFDWASVGPVRPITDQTDEDTVIKVHEAKRTEITYGVGFEVSHRGGNVPAGTVAVPGLPTINVGNRQVAPSQAIYASPRGSIEIIRHNMRGQAETASLSLLASRLDQRVLAAYSDPNFRLTQWNGLTSFSFERTTENPLFAAKLADGAFQLERIISKKSNTRLQFRYDFNHTSLSQLLVPQLVLPQDRNVKLSTVSSALIRDTRDKPLDAHHGSFTTINLGITPTAFGSSANFARFFAQYAYYKPFHGIVFANSIRLGLDKALLGSFVPTSQLFFAGGGTTIRGFPIDEAGPQRIVPFCNVLSGGTGCVNVTVPVGGRQLFILNSEMRFPLGIMKALGGVVFYDGGNVYSAINFNQFVSSYTSTIGIGIRYATPVGPVRIDFGHRLNSIPGISENQYFITLGQSF